MQSDTAAVKAARHTRSFKNRKCGVNAERIEFGVYRQTEPLSIFIDGGYFSCQSLYFHHLYYNVIIQAIFSGCDSDCFFKRLIEISRVIKSAL